MKLLNLNKTIILWESINNSGVIDLIDNTAIKLGIPLTIIGGIAVNEYGYSRYTADLDILIKKNDVQRFVDNLLDLCFSPHGNNKLKHVSGLILNLCAEGVRAGGKPFPPPETETPGLNLVSLPLLIKLKLKANRHRDRADIEELLRIHGRETIQKISGLSIMDKRMLEAIIDKI